MRASVFPICGLAFLFGISTGGRAQADPVIIYSNFGPPPGFVQHDWAVPGHFPGAPFYHQTDQSQFAMGFRVSEDAVLTSMTFPVVWAQELPNGIVARVLPTEDGVPFFTCDIACVELPVPATASPFTASLLTADTEGQPMLHAGATYFLFVHVRAPGFDTIYWPWNNAGAEGTVVDFFLGPTFRNGRLAAFQIEGEQAPVPEPATLLLLATGAGAIAARTRRRR